MSYAYQCTKWEVSIEAPPPRDVFSEDASKQRTNGVCECESCTECTEDQGTLLEPSDLRDDDNYGDHNPACTDASDGTTKDEEVDVPGNTAEQRADLEDEDGAEIDPFCGDNGEELSNRQQETSLCLNSH